MTDQTSPEQTAAPAPEAKAPSAPTPAPAAAAEKGEAAADTPPARQIKYRDKDIPVPENFWDGEGVNVEALLKSHGDLRAQVSKMPKAPEAYDLNAGLPEEFKGKLDLSLDNPVVAKGVEIAKGLNIPQEGMAKLTEWLAMRDAATLQAAAAEEEKATHAQKAEAVSLLGGQAQYDGAIAWVKETLGGEEFLTTPKGLAALAKLRAGLTGGQIPGTRAAPSGQEGLSEAKLRSMMNDPRYWKTKDPDFVRQVSEGFKKLYPEEEG